VPDAGFFGFLPFASLFLVVFVLLAVVAYRRAKQRREGLAAAAARLGLRYCRRDPYGLDDRYRFIDRLATGDNRYAENVIEGEYRAHRVLAFDYHYQVSSGKDTTHYHFSAFVLELDRSFPELIVRPEGVLDRIAAVVGLDDVDFESIEFSRAYHVQAADKRFAYDFFHTRMMEYFLSGPAISLEVDGPVEAAYDTTLVTPDGLSSRLDMLVDIRELMPAYLFDNV
jgi:hypothetical protein